MVRGQVSRLNRNRKDQANLSAEQIECQRRYGREYYKRGKVNGKTHLVRSAKTI